jgi:hypothetical protein
MPSRARAPARTVSGSHLPPKGSVHAEAPAVHARGPARAPLKSAKKAATAVKKTAPTKKTASVANKGKGKPPLPLRRGFTVFLADAAADPPMDVDPPVASAKKGAKGKGQARPSH